MCTYNRIKGNVANIKICGTKQTELYIFQRENSCETCNLESMLVFFKNTSLFTHSHFIIIFLLLPISLCNVLRYDSVLV